jgi:hypothetical protein
MKKELSKFYAEFNKHGIFLLSDPVLPSLVTLIAEKPVKGSWWGHPKGHLIYNLSQKIEDDPDILTIKLINKKITYLHKRHWNAFFSLVTSKSDWQLKGLSISHRSLMEMVQKNGSIRADDNSFNKTPTEIGKIAAKLEEKAIVYSQGLHTNSGKHVRLLKSWKRLIRDLRYPFKKVKAEEALCYFDDLIQNWALESSVKVKLPWK